jgi:hypothetical protein
MFFATPSACCGEIYSNPGRIPLGPVGVFVLSETLCHKQAVVGQLVQPVERHESAPSGGCVVNIGQCHTGDLAFSR